MKKNQIKMSPSARGSLFRDERGMSTVEYVILLAVIVMGAVSVWTSIGGKILTSLQGSDDALTDVPGNSDEAKGLAE